MKRLIYPFIIAAALAGVVHARADYQACCNGTKPVKWNTTQITLKLSTEFGPTGIFRQEFIDAVNGWNGLQGSAFRFTITDDNDNSATPEGDGNEVDWVNSCFDFPEEPDVNCPGAAAVTQSFYTLCQTCSSWTCGGESCSAGHYVETDIYFIGNDFYSFADPGNWVDANANGPVDNGAVPEINFFRVIASHELGHAAGLLENTFSGMARMESHVPTGGWYNSQVTASTRVVPLGFDAAEMNFLYPGPGSADLYAANLQHFGTANPDDNVNSVPLSWNGFDPIAFPFNATAFRGIDARTAFPGDLMFVRVCFGNAGPAFNANSPIRFVFTTDENPTPGMFGDALTVDNWSFGNFPGFWSQCNDLTITVPNVIGFGTMYNIAVGVGTIPGGNSNNWTFINRKVRVI